MILIITRQDDSHSNAVTAELKRRGRPFFRFEPDRLSAFPAISWTNTGWVHPQLLPSCHFDWNNITSVWFRRPDLPIVSRDTCLTKDAIRVTHIRGIVEATWHLLENRTWINPLRPSWAARAKPFQLKLAAIAGLEVPRTLISNDPNEIIKFSKACGDMVYKPLTSHCETDQRGHSRGLYAAGVTHDFVVKHRDQLQRSPSIFQERIRKQADIRVTVLGDQIFATAIIPPRNANTTVDWRSDIASRRFSSITLPNGILLAVRKLMNLMHLRTSCLDFLLTQDDRYVFLEANPDGQWLWVQHTTGSPVLDAFVELLV